MNKTILRIKQVVLSTSLGQLLRDKKHKKEYTIEMAQKASIKYYGSDKYARDMLKEARENDVLFSEYHMYHFEKLDKGSRREFIPLREAKKIQEKLNTYKDSAVFYSKGDTYKAFKKFYKRDVVEIKNYSEDEYITMKELCNKHIKLIFKPYDGAEGHGIEVLSVKDKNFFDFWNILKLKYRNGFVAEEVLNQDVVLNQVYSNSVNTLRIATIVTGNEVEILPSVWRCGRGEYC